MKTYCAIKSDLLHADRLSIEIAPDVYDGLLPAQPAGEVRVIANPRSWGDKWPMDQGYQRVLSVRAAAIATRAMRNLNPEPCEGHTWARCADLRDGGRLYTCGCGHQTRVSGPSATEVEALAREVLRCVK